MDTAVAFDKAFENLQNAYDGIHQVYPGSEEWFRLPVEERRKFVDELSKYGYVPPKRDGVLTETMEGLADSSLRVLQGLGSTLSEAGVTDALDEYASGVRARHRDIEVPEDYRALSWRPSDIGRTIGNAVGTTVPSMVVGGVTAMATGNPALGMAASTAAMFSHTWGDKVREYREAMPDMDEAGIKGLAAFEALGESLIENYGPWDVGRGIYGALAKRATRQAVEETTKRFGRQAVWNVLKKMGTSAMEEGTEEIAQSYWDALCRYLGGDRNVPWPTWDQIKEEFAGGAIGGMGLGAAGAAFEGGVNRLDRWAHETPAQDAPKKQPVKLDATTQEDKQKALDMVQTIAGMTGVKANVATPEQMDAKYQEISQKLGITFEEAKKGELDGWRNPDNSDEVYINPNSKRGVLRAYGHEFKHWLDEKHPDLSGVFDEQALSMLNDRGKAELEKVKKDYGDGKLGDGQTEFLADTYGRLLADPNTLESFCKKLEGSKQGAGRQFVETVRQFVREVLDYLKANGQEGSKMFETYSRLEEECADIMNQVSELNHYGRNEDAAEFFRTHKMTREEALDESFLKEQDTSRNTANGYWIGTYAGDNLYANFRDGDISANKAAAIAEVAQGNLALEDAGLKMKNMPAAQMRSALSLLKQSLERQGENPEGKEQLLFDGLFNDDAIKLAERQSRVAATHIGDLRRKVKLAEAAEKLSRDKLNVKEVSKQLGVTVRSHADVKRQLESFQQELNRWEHYDTDAELIGQINDELDGVQPKEKPAEKLKPERVKAESGLTSKVRNEETAEDKTQKETKPESKPEEKQTAQAEEQKAESAQVEQTQKTEKPTSEEAQEETQKKSKSEESTAEEQKTAEPQAEKPAAEEAKPTAGETVTAERIMPVLTAPGSRVSLVAASPEGEGIVIRHIRPGLVSFFIPQKLLKGRNSVFGTSVEHESLLGRREAPVNGRDRFSRFLVTPEDTEALRRAVELIEKNYGLALDPRMDAAAAEAVQKAMPAEAVQETTAKDKAAPTEAEENAWIELLDRLPRHEDIDTLAEGDYVAFNTSNGKTSSGFVTDIGQKSITVRRWNNSSRQWDTMTVPKEDYLQHTSAAELVENFRGQTNLAEKIGFHFPEEIQSAIEEKAAGEKQETPNPPSDSGEYNSESGTVFSYVPKGELLDRLETEPTVKVFRAMQVIDGKLYPPMAGKVDGKWQEPVRLGQWMQADERPELVKDGKFKLDKGNGSSIQAAYNPYFHTSRSPLNDQFSSAYKRANLVTVECEVPQSELSSGYRAEGAKDAVGEMAWHSGPVSSQLAKTGQPRQVILSRYVKVNRIVPDAEVAQQIARQLEGTVIAIPENVVTPSLRQELEKLGVPFSEKMGQRRGAGGNTSLAQINQEFNNELDKYDQLDSGHIFRLGLPGQLLQDYGFSENPLELSRRVIEQKANDQAHPFTPQDLKNLPDAIQKPLAIFKYSDPAKLNLIVDLSAGGKNFLVGVQLNSTYRGNMVNNIRGLLPKDTHEWLNWIQQDKALYLDKNKIQDLITQSGINLLKVSYLNLDSVLKIIQDFDNASHKVKKTEFSYTPRQWKEMDKAYLDAVQRGDMETAERMVREREAEMGYSADESWKMDHRAPNSKDDVSLIDLKASGLVPADYWDHPKWYTSSPEEGESFRIIKAALELAERRKAEGNERPVGIWVYRAVDKTKNRLEGRLRNGDWVTPSRAYAENEGRDNPNGYRIIRQHCLLRNLYWDGNSIAELGFDDGNDYSYKDTANNRKLRDVVTYDDEGNVIPLSKRFNHKEYDTRFSYRRQQVNPVIEDGQYRDEYQAGLDADLYERKSDETLRRQARDEITRLGGMKAALDAFLSGKRRIVRDVEHTMARILVNTPEYQELPQERRKAFNRLYQQAGTEEGRALRARRLGNLDLRDIDNLRRYVREFAADMQLQHPEDNVRKKIQDATGIDIDNIPEELAKDHDELDRVLREASSLFASKPDKAYEYWVEAILSALTTHIANTIGNVGNMLYELGPKRLAEAIVNLLAKNPSGATFGEMRHMWAAFNWKQAWESAKPLLFHDMLDANGKFDEYGTRAAIGGTKGRIIRTPGRLLRFADQFAKCLIRPIEASAMAYREAKAQNLSGAAAKEYIQKQLADENSHANEYGRQRALELTFNEDPGSGVNAIIQLRNSNKVVAYLLPFIRTPANLLRQGIRKGPMGALNLAWETVQLARGKRKADNEYIAHVAEQLVFWGGMMTLLAGHGDDDEPWITGNQRVFGPEGAFKRVQLPPLSIRIGGKWYSYQRIEPLATGLSTFADGYNAYRDARDGQKMTAALKQMMTGAGKIITEKSYLQSFDEAYRLLSDPEHKLLDWAANFGASWIPNAYRQTVNAFHDHAPNYKAGSKNWLLNTFQQTFSRAGLYRQVPKLDYFGRPVPKDLPDDQVGVGSVAWRLLMPVARRDAKGMDPVEQLMWNYNAEAETPYWPSLPSPYFQMDGKRYEVANYDAYAIRAGQLAHEEMLRQVKQGRLNVRHPGKYDIDLIRKIFSTARKHAKIEFLQKKQVNRR